YHKSDLTHGLLRYLGKGLLTNEGADWLRQRRLIQPGFHRQRLAGLTRLMRAAADEWVAELDGQTAADKAKNGIELDAHTAMTRVAFRIVARSVFGNSLSDAELMQLSDWLTAIQLFYVTTIRQPYLLPLQHLRGRYRHHDDLAQRLRELVRAAIARHRATQAAAPANAAPPDDLLQMLLDARYEDTGEPMTEHQLIDELNILLVAGHETSANALAWGFYLLACHPEAQEKLLAVIAETIIPKTTTPGAKELGLHLFVLTMLDDCYNKQDQQDFMAGLTQFSELSAKKSATGFALWPKAEREAFLLSIEQKNEYPAELIRFYKITKDKTLQGYTQSQFFMTKEVVYELVPGRYVVNVPVKKAIKTAGK
ncbi:MAG: cytochrome P450, partial [Hymenobacter sp.]